MRYISATMDRATGRIQRHRPIRVRDEPDRHQGKTTYLSQPARSRLTLVSYAAGRAVSILYTQSVQ